MIRRRPRVIPTAALVLMVTAIAVVAQSRINANADRARTIVALISQGQLTLRTATEIAEGYCKGIAIETLCDIQPLEMQRPAVIRPGPKPSGVATQPSPLAAQSLVYSVTCYAKDRVQVIRVDGATKKIIDVQDQAMIPAPARGGEETKR